MLEKIFIDVLNMSITASIVILFIIVLRFFLKPMPKIYSYLLWSIVLFRLLCPISFTTNYSLLGLLNNSVVEVEQGKIEYISKNLLENLNEAQTSKNNTKMNKEHKKETNKLDVSNKLSKITKLFFDNYSINIWIKIGIIIWFFGIVFLGINSIRKYILLKKHLKEAIFEKENIYFLKTATTPFTIGFFKPIIILPMYLNEKEKEYIIVHEQIHIRRKDHIIRMISFLLVCIHWFNPFIWCAFFLSGIDMEMSCDEAVVKKYGNVIRKQYSMSLLSLSSGEQIRNGMVLSFGEGDTKERIKNILNFKQPKKITNIITICICILAGVFLLANPILEKNKSNVEIYNYEVENKNINSQNSNTFSDNNTLAEKVNFLYHIYSISRSAKCIDRYKIPSEEDIKQLELEDAYNEETGMIDESLIFAENCVFKINYSMNTIEYEESSFDTFADIIGECNPNLNKPCIVTIEKENRLVTEVILVDAYVNYGIGFSEKTKDTSYMDMVEIVKEVDGMDSDMLEKYYTLTYSSLLDSSKVWDVVENETYNERIGVNEEIEAIEVYTGSIGDGDSGYVIIRNTKGEIIHTEFVHTARAGWNNIYLGSIDGMDYLMTVHIEDRDNFGEYRYEVFRLDKDGLIVQIAGSRFSFGDYYIYDDDLFKEWVTGLEYYLENSHLILSSQEGEIHTKEKEVYNYETLRR